MTMLMKAAGTTRSTGDPRILSTGPGRDYRDRSGFLKGLAHARNTQG